ncbi:unnamed protein product [Trichobilharzia regenti]|nr:unnamed protein product [Trichobilharzia regenti]
MMDQKEFSADIPHQVIYDSFGQSIFSDSQNNCRSPRLTNYAYFMTEKCGLDKTRELKDEKYKTTDDSDEEKIKTDEQCTNNSKENLLLVKKWTQIDNETTLKPPYIWIPSRAPNDSKSKPMKRRKLKQKGKGDLLFMLASRPEKCQSFVQQTQLVKRNADESEKGEQETRSGQDKVMSETASMVS